MFGGFFVRRGGYDPFEDIFRQFQEMEKLMAEMMRGFGGFGREFPGFEAGFEPRIEMYETPDEVVVRAEMPGLDKDSIDVKVRGNYLISKHYALIKRLTPLKWLMIITKPVAYY